MKINIGITGSNGFIGWHLSQSIKLKANNFELVEFKRDWFNEESKLDNFVSKCDTIVHLAGLNRHSEPNIIFDTNIGLANKLVDSFNRIKFKGQVVFSSSIHEEKNNIFGNSKKEARKIFTKWAKKNGTQFKALIIPNVYGPFGVPFYNSVVATFCHQLVNNENPKIETDATLNLIYINDLVKIIIDLLNNPILEIIKIQHTDTYKVSHILDLLKQFKKLYFNNGQIPYFLNQFEVNLFNTFRSYFTLSTHFPVEYKNNIDDRGNFVEIIRLETGGQISFSTTKPGITRGNHFHTQKIERFSVIKGKALIQLRKVGSNEILNFLLNGDQPSFVDIPIWYTHNIKNIGDEVLYTIFWINEPFDPINPDTFFEIV